MTEAIDLRESQLRSLLKAGSYRAVGTVTTWAIAWGVTGDLRFALTIGAIEPIVKMAVYYAHERAWQRVPRGTIRNLSHRLGGRR